MPFNNKKWFLVSRMTYFIIHASLNVFHVRMSDFILKSWSILISLAKILMCVYLTTHVSESEQITLKFVSFLLVQFLPGVMITIAQKSPISASDKRKWLIRCANSKTESIKNFALPGGICWIVSFRMMSPLRQTRLWKQNKKR